MGLALLGIIIGIIMNIICTYISIRLSYRGNYQIYSNLLGGKRGKILKYLIDHPKSTLSEIANDMNLEKNEAAKYLDDLESKQLVKSEKSEKIINRKLIVNLLFSPDTPSPHL